MTLIVSTGIDLVEVARIDAVMRRAGERFRRRIFTDAEIDYCERRAARVESYAARFAAKEASMKALGTGWTGGVAWRDIEVVVGQGGAPRLRFSGRAREVFESLGAREVHISISHARGIAVASVIFER